MKQLKHPPPTNEELTKETIDAVTTAFNHLKRFFNVFDAELDDAIEKAQGLPKIQPKGDPPQRRSPYHRSARHILPDDWTYEKYRKTIDSLKQP